MLEVEIKKGPQIHNTTKFNMDGFVGNGLYSDLNLEGSTGNYRWEDGDTVYDEWNQGYRILGMNAYETEHVGLDKQAYKAGQAGGEIQKQQFYHLANELGYNNLVKTGKKDDYNRYIVDLQDASGQSFATSLYSNGLLKPNYWTSEKDRRAYESRHFNSIMGVDTTTSEWGKAKATIDDHMNSSRMVNRNDGSMVIKQRALNEWQLSAAKDEASRYGLYSSPYMDRAVQYRHEGMDIDGNATNVFRSGISQGWASMKEATSGALSLLGSLTNNEDWYEQGMLNAEARSSEMQRMPKFVQNIDDVTFGENAAEYVMGLGGVSIPWMLGIIGGGALGTLAVGASATGLAMAAGVGIGITPIAVAYAGEIFNNMEGDINTKNAKVAVMGGITMSILDRLGLKGIMKPSQVLKKDGMKQLKDQYIKKEMDILEASPKFAKLNSSQQQVARQDVISRVTKDIKDAKIGGVRDFVSAMAGHADIQIKKRLILKEFGHGVVKGGLWEMGTETAQESTSYLASVYGSEREFNLKEFRNIAKNAAAGGFVMGSTIGGTMNTASGLGSIRKMQSDYGTTGTSAEDGFFNYTTNSQGEITGRAIDKDGNFIPGENMTKDEFIKAQNSINKTNAANRTKYAGATWEPQFIEVEDIHNEMIKDFAVSYTHLTLPTTPYV